MSQPPRLGPPTSTVERSGTVLEIAHPRDRHPLLLWMLTTIAARIEKLPANWADNPDRIR